jgi:GH15 family glucan-1,4-alpha-glucosidase
LSLELIAVTACSESENCCHANFKLIRRSTNLFKPHREKLKLGDAVSSVFTLEEGHAVSFVLREVPKDANITPDINFDRLNELQSGTERFWFDWISQSQYKGRWREVVARSLLLLKLLTYEPTGAIVAAPTFSLPEDFGGSRNWDYRYSWVRDSSFTIYILLRLGFKDEAAAYMNFIAQRLVDSRTPENALPIMFSTFQIIYCYFRHRSNHITGIRGSTDLEEIDLTHFSGYRNSRPVRIGNGAATHKQLDIYGELMDAIYLYNKYGAPISYDLWVSVRCLIDYVCSAWKDVDMSIWEVRGMQQNFVYSKIMMWVAIDRGLRLSEKRMLPCPKRWEWLKTRDEIYEDIMERGYNKELGCFVQSYENREVLDSAVLIAPLVFFIAPNDPRFTKTLERILLPPEKGGLTSAGLVYRYNWLKSDDGKWSYSEISMLYLLTGIRSRWKGGRIFHVHILARRGTCKSRSI